MTSAKRAIKVPAPCRQETGRKFLLSFQGATDFPYADQALGARTGSRNGSVRQQDTWKSHKRRLNYVFLMPVGGQYHHIAHAD